MSDSITRIAMWSGPRNISTAMMRSWENRRDTFVSDEPFYASYLSSTGIDHPGREQIINSQPADWREVIKQCTTTVHPEGKVHYQKHMTQHMLPEIDLEWMAEVVNVFLIRSPMEVVASYAKTRPNLTATDLGFEQQHRLYQHVCENIDPQPLVIASAKVLSDPTAALSLICNKCQLQFDPAMLKWPAGRRDSDGIWAPYWYHNVEKSTGFSPFAKKEVSLNAEQQAIVDQCTPYYSLLEKNVAVV